MGAVITAGITDIKRKKPATPSMEGGLSQGGAGLTARLRISSDRHEAERRQPDHNHGNHDATVGPVHARNAIAPAMERGRSLTA
jgi:hypothetical protein